MDFWKAVFAAIRPDTFDKMQIFATIEVYLLLQGVTVAVSGLYPLSGPDAGCLRSGHPSVCVDLRDGVWAVVVELECKSATHVAGARGAGA
jgi:hypothetical protein